MKIISLTYHHLWWIPTIIIYYIIFSWISKKNNDHFLDGIVWYKQKWIYIAYIYGLVCPFWIIISRISKNILFDGMLYDNIMFIIFAGTMVYLGQGSRFICHQWIGLALVIIGSILMRIEIGN